jgi:transposase InsO family protein
MENVTIAGIVYHPCGSLTDCDLHSPLCQSVEVRWDGGSALLNEDRLGYVSDLAEEQWAKTMRAARLLAAAPDLLAALEEVTRELGWMGNGPRDSDREAFARRVTELRGLSLAAIAKAKGSCEAQ